MSIFFLVSLKEFKGRLSTFFLVSVTPRNEDKGLKETGLPSRNLSSPHHVLN